MRLKVSVDDVNVLGLSSYPSLAAEARQHPLSSMGYTEAAAMLRWSWIACAITVQNLPRTPERNCAQAASSVHITEGVVAVTAEDQAVQQLEMPREHVAVAESVEEVLELRIALADDGTEEYDVCELAPDGEPPCGRGVHWL